MVLMWLISNNVEIHTHTHTHTGGYTLIYDNSFLRGGGKVESRMIKGITSYVKYFTSLI